MLIKTFNFNENSKTILLNAMGALLVKGGALIVSILTIPAYIRYFDNHQVLGLWFTIVSVLSWVLTLDLGVGNGLRNHLVPALVSNDHLQIKKYISSAYVIIGIVVLLVLAVSIAVFQSVNWNIIFNISTTVVSRQTLNTVVFIVFMGIMLQFFFRLITSILYAMQKSALNNFLRLLSSLIVLLYVSFAGSDGVSSDLIHMAIVHVLAFNMPLILATIFLFSKNLKDCMPRLEYYEHRYAKNVLALGGLFFWVQAMYLIIIITNEFLIAWLTAPEKVVEYQIYNRVFTLMGAIFMLALTPIWSAVTKSIAEKNYSWVSRLYNILKLMSILAVVVQLSIIPFLQFGVNIWLGDNAIDVNYLYAAVFAIFGSMFIWNGVISSITNGIGELKILSIWYTIGAMIKIPAAWYLVGVFNSWIGVVVASILAMSLFCIFQPLWLNRFLDRKQFGGENLETKPC